MFVADIKNKLTCSELISEDLLTSSVFSVLDYLSGHWLEEFLNNSMNLKREKLCLKLNDAHLEFWPWYPNESKYGNGAIPDVVIFSDDIALIVEAKNYAGKTGEGILSSEVDDKSVHKVQKIIVDQLGREYYVGLKQILNSVNIHSKSHRLIRQFYIIYLTRHAVFPEHEIVETVKSIANIDENEQHHSTDRIYWLNWQKVIPIIDQVLSLSDTNLCEFKIARDLRQFLERRDLVRFSGFAFVDKYIKIFKNMSKVARKGVFYKKISRPYWRFLDRDYKIDIDNNVFYQKDKENK